MTRPPLTPETAFDVLSRAEVVAIVDARPEQDRLEAIAWGSYSTALAAQRRGAPSREVGAIMLAFGMYAMEYEAERAAAIFESA